MDGIGDEAEVFGAVILPRVAYQGQQAVAPVQCYRHVVHDVALAAYLQDASLKFDWGIRIPADDCQVIREYFDVDVRSRVYGHIVLHREVECLAGE